MTRSDRLAHNLLKRSSPRFAAPEDFDPKSRDKNDLTDHEEDPTDIEEGWNLNPTDSKENKDSLFDEDDLDFEDDDHEHHSSPETLRKTRLKLLAGMIWAYLGEPTAVVEESSPNELSVKVQDLSWRVFVNEDGRVNISGFSSGSDHFVGKLPDEDAESSILKISKNIHKLISDDIDEKSVPTEPPVHFGPEDEPGEEISETGEGQEPPAAPEGDQGSSPTTLPPDMTTEAPPAPETGMTAPQPAPQPAQGAAAPAQPFPPQQNPMAPMASVLRFNRRTYDHTRQSSRKIATGRLEEVSGQLRSIGESLGDDGEETFRTLADRVDQVTKTLEQTSP